MSKQDQITEADKATIEAFAKNLGQTFSDRVLDYYLTLIRFTAEEANKE